MANHGCINGTLNGANYSSPMPLIGLYVAVASLLCMLFIIHDVVFGILARKRWLPSNKLFGFNSATMILLSVAVKLPVDLTTSMPSLQDQLSKLSGTVLICICMAFLMPSLGVNSDSERLTNMLGLSIYVITVAVNICIQIYTGVIVLFITEHIIILSFMLLLLVMLWYISYTFNGERKLTNGLLNSFLTTGDSNMFERLKFCHLYACSSDPQYKISVHPTNGSVSTISLICAVILLQATIRSLILKKLDFCQGKSAYKWSILPIVVIQVFTVIVGTVAIVYRWLSLFIHMDLGQTIVSILNDDELTKMRQTLRKELITRLRLLKFCASLFTRTVSIVQLLLVFPWVLIRKIFRLYKNDRLDNETLIPVSQCMLQKGMDNLIRLKDQVYNRKPLTHLVQFLSQEHIQRANLINSNRVGTEYGRWCQRSNMQVCSLSIAFLVKIAQASIPNNYLESLLRAFNEANEIIHFVDKKTHFLRPESVQKAAYARDLWAGGDFTCLLPDDIIGACPSQSGLQAGVDHAIAKISTFKAILEPYRIYSEVPVVADFINSKSYPTVDDLVKSIEQMFADMMHTLLSQLPIAIFIMLMEGSADEGLEKRVRYAMELIFQARTLDGLIYWSFPIAANITSFAYSDDDNVFGLPVAGPLTRLKNVSRNQNEETSV